MDELAQCIRRYWGYDQFLPLQREAMESVLGGRDSLVVLPTGGGKSLCFQAPAMLMPGLAVVVSPLISLMKDQVDALCDCGVPAARMDSTQSAGDRSAVRREIGEGRLKLLYVAPERLMMDGFLDYVRGAGLSFIAIDEAHCISMWGHDFRPEYRMLGRLKESLPGVAIHAYTATATPQVREDVALQLRLEQPMVLVGSFDRPNLIYRVRARVGSGVAQVCEVIERHKGESGIVYCMRRADVDAMCAALRGRGYRAAPYHAGMAAEDRKASQDAFALEQVEVIVATVAFGMGIDKSNVRYVVHAAMPKSLEHYQQESGRAGRDGLEAECCLFCSGGDYGVWRGLLAEMESEEARQVALRKAGAMYGYCAEACCRRRAILEYFGERLRPGGCGGCDVCLGEAEAMEGGLETAQKILSCVLRLRQRFGAAYVGSVLVGSRDQRILEAGHESLSTHGLLHGHSRSLVRQWIDQLVGQGFLAREGEYDVLKVTPQGARMLKGEGAPRLSKPPEKAAKVRKAAVDAASWDGVDHGLFEALRTVRGRLAAERGVPAYVVFGDAALRDMARRRPATPEEFLACHGVGEVKRAQYGDAFLAAIRDYGGAV